MSTIKVEGYFIKTNDEKVKSGKENKVTAEFPEHLLLYELFENTTEGDKKGYIATIFFHPDEVKEGNVPYGFRVMRHIGRTF